MSFLNSPLSEFSIVWLIATQVCTFTIHWKWQSWGFYFVWLPGWCLTAVINNIHTEQLWWCQLRLSFLSSCWFCEYLEWNTHQFTQMNNMDYWCVVFDSCGYFATILGLLLYWLCSIMMAGQGWHHQDSSVRMSVSRWTEVEVFLFCHYVGFVSTLHLCFSYCWRLWNCGSIVVLLVLPCHMVYFFC